MGYKIYEDFYGFSIRDRDNNYMFETDTREKANKIIKALEKQIVQKRVGEEGYPHCPSCGDGMKRPTRKELINLLADLFYAYTNKDVETPHDFEVKAVRSTCRVLWRETEHYINRTLEMYENGEK